VKRIALVAAVWFALWMVLGAALGGLTGREHGGWENALYAGFFNGAWLAVLTSFAWPWIMPRRLERWMYGSPDEQI
jgi:hypothetical protein